MEDREKPWKEGDSCPQCGAPLVLRHSERGDFLGCSEYPAGDFLTPIAISHNVKVILDLNAECPQCGALLQVKRGRYGIFIGCSNYPSCNFVASHNQEAEVDCPICRKGSLKKRSNRQGRIFYACSRYPSCDYALSGKPVAQSCDCCGFPLKYEKITKKGIKLICGNPLCSTRRRKKASARGENTC